ncbi:hypothetical protein B0H19DRAFT_1157444 [Mycena capillaripes]|nr:hypothetical protein B0H19DRAFT_1157444 [Mycena capillaripes]
MTNLKSHLQHPSSSLFLPSHQSSEPSFLGLLMALAEIWETSFAVPFSLACIFVFNAARFPDVQALSPELQYFITGALLVGIPLLWNLLLRSIGLGSQAWTLKNVLIFFLFIIFIPFGLLAGLLESLGVIRLPDDLRDGVREGEGKSPRPPISKEPSSAAISPTPTIEKDTTDPDSLLDFKFVYVLSNPATNSCTPAAVKPEEGNPDSMV